MNIVVVVDVHEIVISTLVVDDSLNSAGGKAFPAKAKGCVLVELPPVSCHCILHQWCGIQAPLCLEPCNEIGIAGDLVNWTAANYFVGSLCKCQKWKCEYECENESFH